MAEGDGVPNHIFGAMSLPPAFSKIGANMQHQGRLPQFNELRDMTPEQIAEVILLAVAHDLQEHGGTRDLMWIARSLAQQTGNVTESARVEPLFMEALQWMTANGLLMRSGDGNRYRLTRAGQAAVAGERPIALKASRHVEAQVQSAEELLHPAVRHAAWEQYLRREYDEAVFNAFRRVEITVRARSGAQSFGIDLMNEAFGIQRGGQRGVLTPAPMDSGEAIALRSLFAGAYGAFRNPAAHRIVGHDATQCLRLLITASAMLYVLDELTSPSA